MRKSWWRTFSRIGAYAALLALVACSDNPTSPITQAARDFANAHWAYDRYAVGLETVYGVESDTLPFMYFDPSQGMVERYFSHHIVPDEEGNINKNTQYYENIGKYDQFMFGWDDFPELSEPEDTIGVDPLTPHRKAYLDLWQF